MSDKETIQLSGSNDTPAIGPIGFCRPSPVTFAKAVKNEAELEGMRNSHLR